MMGGSRDHPWTEEGQKPWKAEGLPGIEAVREDPVSGNLLHTFWPSYSLTRPGTGENYFSTDPEFGHSCNGLVKLAYALNSKNNFSFHWFSGEGNRTAPVGSSLFYYYEVAPIHVQNYALVLDTLLSPRINNQIEIGVNYFNQVFNDDKKNFDLAATGFLSGSQYPAVAPYLRISSVPVAASSSRAPVSVRLIRVTGIISGRGSAFPGSLPEQPFTWGRRFLLRSARHQRLSRQSHQQQLSDRSSGQPAGPESFLTQT